MHYVLIGTVKIFVLSKISDERGDLSFSVASNMMLLSVFQLKSIDYNLIWLITGYKIFIMNVKK